MLEHVCGNSSESTIEAMEARVGEDGAKVGVGSESPHQRLAGVEGGEHGVSQGGGDVLGHAA